MLFQKWIRLRITLAAHLLTPPGKHQKPRVPLCHGLLLGWKRIKMHIGNLMWWKWEEEKDWRLETNVKTSYTSCSWNVWENMQYEVFLRTGKCRSVIAGTVFKQWINFVMVTFTKFLTQWFHSACKWRRRMPEDIVHVVLKGETKLADAKYW